MAIDIIITFATREVAQLTTQKTEATLESVQQVAVNPLISKFFNMKVTSEVLWSRRKARNCALFDEIFSFLTDFRYVK